MNKLIVLFSFIVLTNNLHAQNSDKIEYFSVIGDTLNNADRMFLKSKNSDRSNTSELEQYYTMHSIISFDEAIKIADQHNFNSVKAYLKFSNDTVYWIFKGPEKRNAKYGVGGKYKYPEIAINARNGDFCYKKKVKGTWHH